MILKYHKQHDFIFWKGSNKRKWKYYSLTSFGCRDFSESFLCDYKKNYVCVKYHRALDQPPQKRKEKQKDFFPI